MPSPPGHWLLGHLRPFQKGPKHLVLEDWAKVCGDLYQIRLGTISFVVSSDPDINGEILKKRPDEFRRHPKITEILEELGVLAVFNAEGATWGRHRKPVSEALNLRKVRSFYPTLVEKTNQLYHLLKQHAKTKEPIDITTLISRFTTDLTTRIAFGYELNTLGGKQDEIHRCLSEVFPMVNKRMTAPLPLWRWYKSKATRDFDRSLQTLKDTIFQFITDAQIRLDDHPELAAHPANFLEALLSEKEDYVFSREEVFSSIFTLLLAGEDTTSNSLAWCLYYLAQYPQVVEKVRKEACAVFGSELTPQTAQHHTMLPYTLAVVQEAIRLKPTSPQLILQAQQEVSIGPHSFPQGTNIILQNRVAQIREAHFSDAQSFFPERWLPKQCPVHYHHDGDVIKAFGGGPRYCPGTQLAMHEMVIVLATLCKHFEFDMVEDPTEIGEVFSFTMHPKPFQLKLRLI